jgi:hypothetical protein
LFNNSGIIDSGNIFSRIITVTYSSNNAAGITDSVKLRYKTACGYGAYRALKLSNTALLVPTAPATITIQSVTPYVCGARTYRYIAPTLPIATTTTAAATGWQWELLGSLSEYASIDSGDENSKVILVTFSSNEAAQTGDSIKLYYLSACGITKAKASKFSNVKLSPPTAPASITIQSLVTNVCGARTYRYIAPALPASSTTTGAATGWNWMMPYGVLGSTGVLDSGTLNSRIIVIKYSSNAASVTGDSIKLRYNSGCGFSLYKAAKLTNVLLSPPLAPASITIAQVLNDCGARIYRYTMPTLPIATTTSGAATDYQWSLPFGPVGSTGTLDSASLSSRVMRIVYTSNDAAVTGDSIKARYNSGCGFGAYKAQKLSNLIKTGCPINVKLPFTKIDSSKIKIDAKIHAVVFPNPTHTAFNLMVKSNESIENIGVRVIDAQGRMLKSISSKSNQNIVLGSDFKIGVYIFEITMNGQVEYVRGVKF